LTKIEKKWYYKFRFWS